MADIVGIELLLAAQAMDWRLRGERVVDGQIVAGEPEQMSPELLALHARIRGVVDYWHDDQVMHPALAAVGGLVRGGVREAAAVGW